MTVFERRANDVRVRMQVHKQVTDTGPAAQLKPDVEHGDTPNRHQAFGYVIGERAQPGAMAGR